MTTFLQEKQEKMQTFYCCKQCDFNTSNKYNYEKHLSTAKHQNTTKYNKNTTNMQDIMHSSELHVCQCGKLYRHRASLYNHKKKCLYNKLSTVECDLSKNFIAGTNSNKIDGSKDLILKLVEENTEIRSLLFKQFETMQTQMQEQQRMMHDQINELIPHVGNNNTINKQKFNINIFLKEQCKDALTMEQFINKIDVTMA